MNIGYIVLLCIVDVGLFATKSLITFALFCFGMHIVFKNKKNRVKTQPKEKQFVSEVGRLSKEYKAVQRARRLHKQLELRKSIDTEHDRSRKMMRELSMEEILSTTNTGNNNTGTGNSGCWNSGNGNSGSWNSGHRNSGSWNSGSFCSCNNSSGFFMSKRISYEAFNKSLSEEEYRDLIRSEGFRILSGFKLYAYKEKDVLSRLRYLPYKISWKMFWQTLTPKEKLAVKRMPHFDAQVFYEITGIKLGLVQK